MTSGTSFEDLRDLYKSNKQKSRGIRYPVNGSTSRAFPFNQKGPNSFLIRTDTTSQKNGTDLNRINKHYCITEDQVTYSLDKKKRWQIKSDLVTRMIDFKLDGVDVKLFETAPIGALSTNGPKVLSYHRSKDETTISPQKKSGNFKSILAQERIDQHRRLTAGPSVPVKKPNRFKPINRFQKSNRNGIEHIVIQSEESDSEDEEAYAGSSRYVIEYGPNKQELKKTQKYSHLLCKPYNYNKNECRRRNHNTKTYLSELDEPLSVSEGSDNTESDEDPVTGTTFGDLEHFANASKTIEFEDLLKKLAIDLVEKQKLNELKNKKEIEKYKQKKAITKEAEFLPKNQLVYIEDKSQASKYQANSSTNKYQRPVLSRFDLDPASISGDNLKEAFGARYNEAEVAWPRHFNLDLSESIKQELTNKTGTKYEVCVWLRFKQIVEGGVALESSYFVSICSNLNCDSLCLPQNTHEVCTIGDVVKNAMNLIMQQPIEAFPAKQTPTVTRSNSQSFVAELQVISGVKQSKSIELSDLKYELIENWYDLEQLKSLEELRQASIESIHASNAYTCILCFDDKTSLDDCCLATACGHALCSDCIRDYVDSRLAYGLASAGKFPCPSCENQLDLSLMINYASNGSALDTYLRLSAEQVLFNLKNYKWCPAGNCGRILKVDLISNPYGIATCICGFKMCLKCNEQPHFPAKCAQFVSYKNDLAKNGDIKPLEEEKSSHYISMGKYCPNKKCNVYMEKNYGCNHMVCAICKADFCWNCHKLWEEHLRQYSSCSVAHETKDQVEIEFLSKRKSKKVKLVEKENKYEQSVHHRQLRTNTIKKGKREQVKRIMRGLDYSDDLEECQSFLNQAVLFLAELHFICEYSYVSLRSNQTGKRLAISHVIRSLELVIYQMDRQFEQGKGAQAVCALRVLFDRGLNLIRRLNEISV